MLYACTNPITEDEWFDFFVENVFADYTSNRSPFGIYAHSAWFYYGPQCMKALIRFLDQLKDKDDVYIVTPAQMLSWVRDPTPLKDIKEFKAWQCIYQEASPPMRLQGTNLQQDLLRELPAEVLHDSLSLHQSFVERYLV